MMKRYGDFKEKIVNYNSTIMPIASGEKLQQIADATLDSLMSVHFDYIYPTYIHSSIFNRVKQNLTEDDLFYLLHSINPSTRIMVMHYMLCSKRTYSNTTNHWIDYLINNSPAVLTQYGCIREDMSVVDLVKCED